MCFFPYFVWWVVWVEGLNYGVLFKLFYLLWYFVLVGLFGFLGVLLGVLLGILLCMFFGMFFWLWVVGPVNLWLGTIFGPFPGFFHMGFVCGFVCSRGILVIWFLYFLVCSCSALFFFSKLFLLSPVFYCVFRLFFCLGSWVFVHWFLWVSLHFCMLLVLMLMLFVDVHRRTSTLFLWRSIPYF